MPYTLDGLEEELRGEFKAFYADEQFEYYNHFDILSLDIRFNSPIITLARPGDFELIVNGESRSYSGKIIETFHLDKPAFDKTQNDYDMLMGFEATGMNVDLLNKIEKTNYSDSDIEKMRENLLDKLNELIDHYGSNKVDVTYELA